MSEDDATPPIAIITDADLAAIEILRRGGDPCSVILPDGWPVQHDKDALPPSSRSFEDLV